ncbi:MAG: hypothetical protein M1269_03770 [Chloroflexi bacterium]|nr:hypothetical protein [Chloroflexota bacterium]
MKKSLGVGLFFALLLLCIVPVWAYPNVVIKGNDLQYNTDDLITYGKDGVSIYYGDIIIKAERGEYNAAGNKAVGRHNVEFSKGKDFIIKGDGLEYDFASGKGFIVSFGPPRTIINFDTGKNEVSDPVPDDKWTSVKFMYNPVCSRRVVGTRVVVAPGKVASIYGAKLKVHGKNSFYPLPLYNASLTGKTAYSATPRFTYSNSGLNYNISLATSAYTAPKLNYSQSGLYGTVPFVYINNKSLTGVINYHYNSYRGVQSSTFNLDHTFATSPKGLLNFSIQNVQDNRLRAFTSQYQHKFNNSMRATTNLNWNNDNSANFNMYLYKQLKMGSFNLQVRGNKASHVTQTRLPSVNMNFDLGSRKLLGKYLSFSSSLSGGYNYAEPSITAPGKTVWFKSLRLGLAPANLRIGSSGISTSFSAQRVWKTDRSMDTNLYGSVSYGQKLFKYINYRINYNYSFFGGGGGDAGDVTSNLNMKYALSVTANPKPYLSLRYDTYYDPREKRFTYTSANAGTSLKLNLFNAMSINLNPAYDFYTRKITLNYYLQSSSF